MPRSVVTHHASHCSKCYADWHVHVCTTSLLAQLGAEAALYKWQCSYALLKLHSESMLTASQVAHNGGSLLSVLILLVVNQTLALGQAAHSCLAHTNVHSWLTSASGVNCMHFVRLVWQHRGATCLLPCRMLRSPSWQLLSLWVCA